MTRPTTHHIVASGLFRCLHCGSSYAGPDTATPIDALISVIRGFALMHRHCQPKPEPSPQLALPHTEQNPNGFGRPGHATYHGPPKYSPLVNEVLAGIDGNSDAPDPETDPPGHPDQDRAYLDDETDAEGNQLPSPAYPSVAKPDLFEQLYPMRMLEPELYDELCLTVLNREQVSALDDWWPLPVADQRVYDELAHWSRVSRAHSERQAAKQRGEPSIDGLCVPLVPPMPKVLRRALGKTAPKERKGARPLANPKPQRTAP